MAEQAVEASSGVHDLITRLRDEGVQAGRQEAEQILAKARAEAGRVLDAARQEAAALREQARSDIDKEHEAAQQALKLAARDTVLELRDGIAGYFERNVRRLVSQVTVDEDFVRSLVLVLAGHAASEFVQDRDAEVLVSRVLFGAAADEPAQAAADERTKQFILGITGDMIRQGLDLIPDESIGGGAKVRLKGEEAEVDLSDEAVTALLMKNLLPRFQAILEGSET